MPSESAWLREESCLLSAFIERPVCIHQLMMRTMAYASQERVELRLVPWSFRLAAGLAASGTVAEDVTIEVDPHLTCAQVPAPCLRIALPLTVRSYWRH